MVDMKKLKFQIPIAIVCLVLAFALTWQIKGIPWIRAQEANIPRLEASLEEIVRLQVINGELIAQRNQLQDDNYRLISEVAQGSTFSGVIAEQLYRTRILAGLTDVEGEGVVITLTDNWGLVHDDTILMVLNDLRASGAEAISIGDVSGRNEQRLIATSEVRCTGPTVTVNGFRFATPFVIRAIGNAEMMVSALRMPGGAADLVEWIGATIDIQIEEHIEISAFSGEFVPRYAVPLGTRTASGGDE